MTRKMKDSGVKYLGSIPEDWECVNFRRCVSLKQGLQIAQSNRFYDDGPNRYIYITLKYINSNNKAEKEYIENPDLGVMCGSNDILFVRTGSTGLIVTGVTGVFHNNFFKVIYNKDYILKEYLIYYLNQKNIIEHFSLLAGTTTIPDLNHGDFLGTQVLLPSREEQKRIANYLDNKCTKLDRTIEMQKQVIEKLKEYKQSIITEAVTKGLNPDVKMKDSGIEWIGEMPEHWLCTIISRVAKTSSGSTPLRNKENEYFENANIKWIRTLDLTNGEVYDSSEKITEEALKNSSCSILPVNTILIAMYGGAGTIGKCGILKVEATTNQAICSMICIEALEAKYMLYSLITLRKYWMKYAVGTRKDPNISQDIVSKMKIVIPPISEQREIINYLNEKCTAVDKSISQKEKLIEKLTEYKKSLIYECVTGKREV